MQSDWLAATNFERMHEVLSAINSLAIHTKLTLAGVVDPTPGPEIDAARARLLAFLDRLSAVVEEAESATTGVIVSGDPRLRDLARRLLMEGRDSDPRAGPSDVSPGRLRDLIEAGDLENLRRAVPGLERLGSLIEEHMQADVAAVLGDESW